MALSNLPPGMSERDIPGNSLRDQIWDDFYENVLGPFKAEVYDIILENDPESPLIKRLVAAYRDSFGPDSI